MNGTTTPWTPEMDQYITDNHKTMSASQKADFLSTPERPVTRNAVIGRCNRLGLPKHIRPKAAPKKPRVARNGEVRLAPKREFVSPPMPVSPLNIAYIDLQHFHCREIVDVGLSLSCGHLKIEESSYCRWHHAQNTTDARAPRKPWPYRFAA